MKFSAGSASHSNMDGITRVSANDIGCYGVFMSRSLGLLNAIEQTVFAVSNIFSLVRSLRSGIGRINAGLPSIAEAIDEGEIMSGLAETQELLGKLHARLSRKRAYALQDQSLTEQDGVESIYAEAISEVDGLHEDIETVRWSIMQHNAALDTSSPGEVLTTAQDVDLFFSRI